MSQKINKFFRFAFLALLIVAIGAALVACNKNEEELSSSVPLIDMTARYDSETGTLYARQETLFETPAELKENYLAFHIYANAFAQDNDAIDILSCQIDRKTVEYEICGEDRTLLKLPVDVGGGELLSVVIDYAVRVPEGNARLGREGANVNLTCFYPVLARYENGWREDGYCNIGDPFFSDSACFYVTLTLDSSLEVAASGSTMQSVNGDTKTVEICAENVRDLGIAIGDFDIATRSVSLPSHDVTVSYYHHADTLSDDVLNRACDAIATFSSAFGEYPYDEYTLVRSDLDNAGGMEYGAFVLISPADPDVFLDAVTHETAHQWWYNAVGNDQLTDAWLDEGLSEFCTYYFYRLAGERDRYATAMREISAAYSEFSAFKTTVGLNGKMRRHISTFLTDGEYVAVTYQKGALLFDYLLGVVGDKKLNAALSRYFESNKFKIADADALAAAFKTQGYEISPILSAWIEDTARI